MTALGAATADAIYASIAAFGLSFLSQLLISLQTPVRLVGGVFLLYLGVKTFRSLPAERAANATAQGCWGEYLSTLLLTLTNPLTILLFAGVFTGAGLSVNGDDAGCAPFIVAGVFAGSALWGAGVVIIVSRFKARFTPAALRWVNRLAGAVICLFAVSTLWGVLQ